MEEAFRASSQITLNEGGQQVFERDINGRYMYDELETYVIVEVEHVMQVKLDIYLDESYRNKFQKFSNQKVLQTLMDPSLTDAQRKTMSEKLIQTYIDEWTRFRLGYTNANNFFNYLNQHWIKRQMWEQNPGVYPIGDVRAYENIEYSLSYNFFPDVHSKME